MKIYVVAKVVNFLTYSYSSTAFYLLFY